MEKLKFLTTQITFMRQRCFWRGFFVVLVLNPSRTVQIFAGVQVRTCLRTGVANLSVTLGLFCFAGGLVLLFLPAAITF